MIQSIQKIISLLEDKKISQGNYVFKENDSDPYFYIISSGRVEITKTTLT